RREGQQRPDHHADSRDHLAEVVRVRKAHGTSLELPSDFDARTYTRTWRSLLAAALCKAPYHGLVEPLAVASLRHLDVCTPADRVSDRRVALDRVGDEEEAAHDVGHAQVLARVADGDALPRRVAAGLHVAGHRVRLRGRARD